MAEPQKCRLCGRLGARKVRGHYLCRLCDPPPPDVPGYRLEGELGQGFRTRVYRARDPLDQPVALKLLPPLTDRVRAALDKVFAPVRRLEHPRLARLFDYGLLPMEYAFLAMEIAQGPTAEEVLRREGRLPLPHAVRIGFQVADGLAHAGEAGVLHRDLQPRKIHVDTRGDVKVRGLGLRAFFLKAGPGPGTVQGGSQGGSYNYAYCSPEVFTGGPHAPRDVYSLGAVLYELLIGEPPLTSGDAKRIISERPERVDKIRKEVPKELAVLVSRALEKKPQDRPDMSELAQGLLDQLKSL